ncbi:hypothetical protein GA0115246_1001317 [Streptomyces sp. SolWspMP-sol7th]|nr:hypothetical protein GA0115246_1001317 [Streptomyces sp. SolWspMP-sol7th]
MAPTVPEVPWGAARPCGAAASTTSFHGVPARTRATRRSASISTPPGSRGRIRTASAIEGAAPAEWPVVWTRTPWPRAEA